MSADVNVVVYTANLSVEVFDVNGTPGVRLITPSDVTGSSVTIFVGGATSEETLDQACDRLGLALIRAAVAVRAFPPPSPPPTVGETAERFGAMLDSPVAEMLDDPASQIEIDMLGRGQF